MFTINNKSDKSFITSDFTKETDEAFDEFCKTFLDSNNGIFSCLPQTQKNPANSSNDVFFMKNNNVPTVINNDNNRPKRRITLKPPPIATLALMPSNKTKSIVTNNRTPPPPPFKYKKTATTTKYISHTIASRNYKIVKVQRGAQETAAKQQTVLEEGCPALNKNKLDQSELSNNAQKEQQKFKKEFSPHFKPSQTQHVSDMMTCDETMILNYNSLKNEVDDNKTNIDDDEPTISTSAKTSSASLRVKSQDELVRRMSGLYRENPLQKQVAVCKKPTGWLGLKVIACGMNKRGKLPIPSNNYFLEKGDFGDDAGFWCENEMGDAIGIADGASGNRLLGYDPGDFSRNLMEMCSEFCSRESARMPDAKSLLLKAYDVVQEKTCYGSCTACVMTLNHMNNKMSIVNVGDSGYRVIRNGSIVNKSIPERLSFDCPKQLDSYPWKNESRRMGVSYTEIIGNDTNCEDIQVFKDDMVILSSDGLYDNLEDSEIEEICQKSKTIMDVARNLVYRSVKYYRKPDDILVLIGKLVDNKKPLLTATHQKFSKLTQNN